MMTTRGRVTTSLIFAFGLLEGTTKIRCDAFLVGPKTIKTSTSLASSNNYLENLSKAKPLPAIPAASDEITPSLETSSAITPAFSAPEPTPTPSPDSSTHLSAAAPDFQYVPILSLGQADAIANKVIQCCKRNGFSPVTVYVLDAAGSPLVSKRMDGCSPVGVPDFAKAKAYSCIVNKYPSRAFRDRYTAEEASAKFCQMTSMVAVSGNQMAPFPGGIILKLGDTIVGAVGVSGAAGDEDEYCAIRGVVEANLGLSTVPEHHVLKNVVDGEIDANPLLSVEPFSSSTASGEAFEGSYDLPSADQEEHIVYFLPPWAKKKEVGPW